MVRPLEGIVVALAYASSSSDLARRKQERSRGPPPPWSPSLRSYCSGQDRPEPRESRCFPRWRCSPWSSAGPASCCSPLATPRLRQRPYMRMKRSRHGRIRTPVQRHRPASSRRADRRRGRRADTRAGRLRRELLAGALRDPSVEVAFAIDDGGRPASVDELGRRIEPLRATGSRAVVPILVDGRAVAQIGLRANGDR